MANQIQVPEAGYAVFGLGASWSDVGYQVLQDSTVIEEGSVVSTYGVRAVVSINPEVQVTKVN